MESHTFICWYLLYKHPTIIIISLGFKDYDENDIMLMEMDITLTFFFPKKNEILLWKSFKCIHYPIYKESKKKIIIEFVH